MQYFGVKKKYNGKTNLKVTDFEKDVGANFSSNMHFDEHINITIKSKSTMSGNGKDLTLQQSRVISREFAYDLLLFQSFKKSGAKLAFILEAAVVPEMIINVVSVKA